MVVAFHGTHRDRAVGPAVRDRLVQWGARTSGPHFSPKGSLTIDDGTPAIGRAAITEAVQSFMTAIPDIQVCLDDLVFKDEGVEFHWTFTGTNTGPGGTGNRVRVSGLEDCKLNADKLILESQGQVGAAEYGRQLAHRVDETT